jgi:hypothetical protein
MVRDGLELILVVEEAADLHQHRVLDVVPIHLEQQRADVVVPDGCGVTMGIDDGHALFERRGLDVFIGANRRLGCYRGATKEVGHSERRGRDGTCLQKRSPGYSIV